MNQLSHKGEKLHQEYLEKQRNSTVNKQKKERWICKRDSSGSYIVATESGCMVADCFVPTEERARDIVASHNACLNIPREELEKGIAPPEFDCTGSELVEMMNKDRKILCEDAPGDRFAFGTQHGIDLCVIYIKEHSRLIPFDEFGELNAPVTDLPGNSNGWKAVSDGDE